MTKSHSGKWREFKRLSQESTLTATTAWTVLKGYICKVNVLRWYRIIIQISLNYSCFTLPHTTSDLIFNWLLDVYLCDHWSKSQWADFYLAIQLFPSYHCFQHGPRMIIQSMHWSALLEVSAFLAQSVKRIGQWLSLLYMKLQVGLILVSNKNDRRLKKRKEVLSIIWQDICQNLSYFIQIHS